MPLQATSGAASYDAFGGGVAAVPNYIEEVFSTYLYAGNSSTQTITNGIDLSGKGGLVWTKARVDRYHNLEDTVRGAGNSLWSNASSANYYYSDAITSFGSTGYTLGADGTGNQVNSSANYVSWTFRKQPKFFDVQTWTGNGTNGRTVSHSLGSVPACIIVKRTDASNGWAVYHRSMNASPQDYMMRLNATDGAFTTTPSRWNNTLPTSTEFTLSGNDEVNGSGGTYVAYLFAHNAGGFGLTGTDNVISCSSFTTPSSGEATITLGYEPQWLMVKRSDGTGDWYMVDNMRGLSQTSQSRLDANLSAAEEVNSPPWFKVTATGFTADSGSIGPSRTFIYIAIRRGPMKVPTDGTSVFDDNYGNNLTGAGTIINSSMLVDMYIQKGWSSGSGGFTHDRLRGPLNYLVTSATDAESSTGDWRLDQNTGVGYGSSRDLTGRIGWMFRRAPSFFDEVCYTGTGSATTQAHNLGAVPELMILKPRSNGSNGWCVYSAAVGNTGRLLLDTSDAAITGYSVFWNSTTPTSSVFSLGTAALTNESATTFVAYLFATCAGVSKVGSYTGTGTTLQINCGFTGGARFVLIKRTDSTGDWYVWDSARGIVSGNDPYLLLNSTAAEVTNTDYVDTYSAGFEITSTAPAAINASGGTFIFLAIA